MGRSPDLSARREMRAEPIVSPVTSSNVLIDDFSSTDGMSQLGTRWEALSDQVMGGVSKAHMRRLHYQGRNCVELSGDVRLEQNGGFVQLALDLDPSGLNTDARRFEGLRMWVSGNGETYGVHLRTAGLSRPWQSYRAQFNTSEDWHLVTLPFSDFRAHRVDGQLDLRMLRRLGFIAIGRAFHARLRIAHLEFYA